MDFRLRNFLIVIGVAALAIWVGINLAQEEHMIAMLSAISCLWAILAWVRGPLAEAWLLGFLVFGYIIGNRGFAQLTPISGIPLFWGELGLVGVFSLVLMRGALKRELPIRRDWFNLLLFLWLLIGSGRVLWDVRVYGFLALRDFATVYYALFFFATQALAAHEASRRTLHSILIFTFCLLPITSLLARTFRDFFRDNLLVEGVPLIFYKEDLLATFLFAGFVYLVPKGAVNLRDSWWRWGFALASLYMGFIQLSRAGMLGLSVALGGLALAGRWQPARTVVLASAGAALAVFVYAVVGDKDFTQTKVYALYEHVASVTDIQGTVQYRNEESTDTGDNNRFRLIWWKTVSEETLLQSPVFGLGFGYDLAKGFIAAYSPLMGDEFSARSPHSIVFTTLGRMGLIGVSVLLLTFGTFARMSIQLARRTRSNAAAEGALTLHAMCWVILVSACFGVVLEGPMGAIPFWIILGLAHFEATRETQEEKSKDEGRGSDDESRRAKVEDRTSSV